MTPLEARRQPPPLPLEQPQMGSQRAGQGSLEQYEPSARQAGETSGSIMESGFVYGGMGRGSGLPPHPPGFKSPFPLYQPAPPPAASYPTIFATPTSMYGTAPPFSSQPASNYPAGNVPFPPVATSSSVHFASSAPSASNGAMYNPTPPPSTRGSAWQLPHEMGVPSVECSGPLTICPPPESQGAQPPWPAYALNSAPVSPSALIQPNGMAAYFDSDRAPPMNGSAQLSASLTTASAASPFASASTSTSSVPMAASRPSLRSQRLGQAKSESTSRRRRTRPPPPRTWICPHERCDRSFARPSALNSHLRTHSGDRPFICPCCDRPFSVIYNLQRHMKTHPEVDISNVRPQDIPDMQVDRSLYESVASMYADSPDDPEVDDDFGDVSADSSGRTSPYAETPSPPSSKRRVSAASSSSLSGGCDVVDNGAPLAAPQPLRASTLAPKLEEDRDITPRPQWPQASSYFQHGMAPSSLASRAASTNGLTPTPFVSSLYANNGADGALSTIHEGEPNKGMAGPSAASASSSQWATSSFGEPTWPARSPAPGPIEMRGLRQIEIAGGTSYPALPQPHAQAGNLAPHPFAGQFDYLPSPDDYSFIPLAGTSAGVDGAIPRASNGLPHAAVPPLGILGNSTSAHVHPSQLYHSQPFPQQQNSYPPFHFLQPVHSDGPLPGQARMANPPFTPTESFRSNFARHRPQSTYASALYAPPALPATTDVDLPVPPPLLPGSGEGALGLVGSRVGTAVPVSANNDGDGEAVNTDVRVIRSPVQLQNEWDRLARTPPGAEVVRRKDGGIVFPPVAETGAGVGEGGKTVKAPVEGVA